MTAQGADHQPAAGAASGKTPEPNALIGIALKLTSVITFVVMITIIKYVGPDMPVGEIVFFRSLFAIIPVMVFLGWRREISSAWRTSQPLSHFFRGAVGAIAMGLNFFGVTLLPLPDAIAISYAMPLLIVVFAAIFLGETVRLYRWTAVAIGLSGVLVISWPKLTLIETGLGSREAIGVIALMLFACFAATAAILVRRLVNTEKTNTIVFYFSFNTMLLALLTLPVGFVLAEQAWVVPQSGLFWLMVIAGICGGVAQIMLTQSYRYADVSTIAPFEYASIIFGIAVAYLLFDEIPTLNTILGTIIVVSAGIFIIYREHRLGLERKAQRKLVTPQG